MFRSNLEIPKNGFNNCMRTPKIRNLKLSLMKYLKFWNQGKRMGNP